MRTFDVMVGARAWMLGSAIAAAAIFSVAACLYPGGTHFDHAAVGHDFWRNALCDVARGTAIGGAINPGAPWARAGMTLMAVALGAMFWLLPDHFPSSVRLGRLVRWLGAIAVTSATVVVFLPTDRFSALHGQAIVLAGGPSLAAVALAFVGLLRERERSLLVTAAGGLALLAAAVGFGCYVEELVTGGPPRLAVPVLERVASLLLLAWMITIAWSPSRGQVRTHLCKRLHRRPLASR